MSKRILLINSDLAKNRGDRAIAEGIIELINEQFPGAAITGLSEHAKRDSEWFKIKFLNQDSQSLNPFDLVRLLREARRADFILWGGGEILKDYTNKLALWYWVVKIALLSMANKQIYGAFQGIGPTQAKISRLLIASIVRCTNRFIVRDQESKDKLIAWGVPTDKVVASNDPAVLPSPLKPSKELVARLNELSDVDEAFLQNFICIGPRSWFHYKVGGLIPFRYKKALLKFIGRELGGDSSLYVTYRKQLVAIIDDLLVRFDSSILLIPMHMSEDPEICKYLCNNSTYPERIRVLEDDEYSPAEVRTIISLARALIGFRLHSNIIATASAVPSLNIYYVDKGRVYFDQIGQSHYAFPIDRVLDKTFVSDVNGLVNVLFEKHANIKTDIQKQIVKIRQSIKDAFRAVR